MTTSQKQHLRAPRERWLILGASAIILAVTMGQLVNGLSVYFVPLEVSQGWSRAEIALINTSGLIGLALGSLVMGFAAERFGIRPVALFGVIATGVATILASRAEELWQMYALFLLAGALGGGALSAPLMALVGNWFVVGAGLAIGIASAGQALGQGGMPLAGAFLIEALGWRDALAVQGLFTLVALVPLALLLRDPPETGNGAVLSDQTPSGLPNGLITAWLSLAVLFCCTCMAVPLMHLVPLIQGCGFPAPEASGVLFSMLMVAILGRVAFGRLADMIGAVPAYLVASGWQTTLVFGFTLLGRLDSFYVYAAIYGFGYAGVMTTLLVTVRNLSAPARRASSLGIVIAFAYLGHGLGGWQGGLFYDATGAYSWTFANAAFAGIANLVIVGALWLTINRRPRPTPA
ncbi:MFS transporter [Tropicimonas sediminicola]|uniref:Major Facilitator Superfamily protein n=1 Tax=Tropicimonas sediminicola TaxID=1031541 RepID=A0A239DBV4_9RHOB|nr:MFS transporter [Tropicimonas sediminicola]SNS29552.1 Major Facilitator Superfamily protein [Tropicimonas sediminicola]